MKEAGLAWFGSERHSPPCPPLPPTLWTGGQGSGSGPGEGSHHSPEEQREDTTAKLEGRGGAERGVRHADDKI